MGCIALLLAASVLATGPVTVDLRGPGDPWPPNTAGLSYPRAEAALHAWCPDLRIQVIPSGIPPGADQNLLFVKIDEVGGSAGVGADACGPDHPPLTARLMLYAKAPSLTGMTVERAGPVLAARGLRLDIVAGPVAGQSVITQQAPLPGAAIDIDRTPYASTAVTVATKAPAAGQQAPAVVAGAQNRPSQHATTPGAVTSSQSTATGQGSAGGEGRREPASAQRSSGDPAALAIALMAWSTGVAVLLALALLVTREIRVRRARRRQGAGDPAGAGALPAIRVVPHPDAGHVKVTQSTNARSHSVRVRACGAPATVVLNEAGGQP